MRVRLDGRTYRGRALDLRGADVDASGARAALGLDPADPLATVTATPPSLPRALAAAARERGVDHPADEAISRIEAELVEATEAVAAAGDVAATLSAARERAADTGGDVDRLRERTATLRGRLRALRERDGGARPASDENGAGDPGTGAGPRSAIEEVRSAFAAATRALTEAETERLAAVQALSRADERARVARDARERRLRLRDALANRRREVRADRARALYPAFVDALAAVPSAIDPALAEAVAGTDPGEFDGDPVAGHLAAVRLARRAEPVVVAVPRFGGPGEATTRLRTPVALVDAD